MKTSLKYIVVLVMLVGLFLAKRTLDQTTNTCLTCMNRLVMKLIKNLDAFGNGVEAQLPAEGTIPRGDFMPFEIDNTNEGFA